MSLAERLARTDRPDRLSDVRSRVQRLLVDSLGPKLYDSTLSDRQLQDLVHRRLRALLDEEEVTLSLQEKADRLGVSPDEVPALERQAMDALQAHARARQIIALDTRC